MRDPEQVGENTDGFEAPYRLNGPTLERPAACPAFSRLPKIVPSKCVLDQSYLGAGGNVQLSA